MNNPFHVRVKGALVRDCIRHSSASWLFGMKRETIEQNIIIKLNSLYNYAQVKLGYCWNLCSVCGRNIVGFFARQFLSCLQK